jgi:cytoplasmic iron level regulating protein YaaA (DUF328/UPF0246 family)
VLQAEVGTALVVLGKFIRTSVRKVTGGTDKPGACRQEHISQGHTGSVLILLPPSEKKSAFPGPAIGVYTGVLYAALGWSTLTKAQQQLGQSCIAIISAKYGVVRPMDLIEPYKEKINNKKMADQVSLVLDGAESELIIDCRSSTYQGVWQSPVAITVEIKVFTKTDGVKKVITHMSKKTRGEVTHHILKSTKVPTNPHELEVIISQKFECELIEGSEKIPWVLEVYCSGVSMTL